MLARRFPLLGRRRLLQRVSTGGPRKHAALLVLRGGRLYHHLTTNNGLAILRKATAASSVSEAVAEAEAEWAAELGACEA